MKMFAVRVTPGLRVSWTPRGLRISHLPVDVESLPAALMSALPTPGITAIPSARGRRSSTADRAAEAVERIRCHHLADVVEVQRPTVPAAATATAADLLPALERSLLKGIPGLARRRRRAARVAASVEAAHQADRLRDEAIERQRVEQAQCDSWWTRLVNGDPVAVFSFTIEAFERGAVPAALIDVDGRDLTVVATVPGVDSLPARMPRQTTKGRLSTRTMLRGERAALYSTLVAGHAVLILRQVFAHLPFAGTVHLILLQDAGVGALGLRRLDPLLCVISPRVTFLRSVRPGATAVEILRAGCRDVLQNVDSGQLLPISLDHQDGLRDLLHSIDRT